MAHGTSGIGRSLSFKLKLKICNSKFNPNTQDLKFTPQNSPMPDGQCPMPISNQ
ncbi:MAG: hypothetical protein F6J93_32885 [Oscillatoria sp. SIO1A7]|nr:hypothetical protein [Oscillatoria sp. SIO1A7]